MCFQTGSHHQPSSTRLNVWEFEGSAAQNWPTAVFSLPEWIIKFALNAVTDTPRQYANLCRWKKLSSPQCQLCGEDQSLAHILNSCQKALNLRCYTTRHDDVLKVDILLMRPYVVCTVYQPARAIATLRCIGKICYVLFPFTGKTSNIGGAEMVLERPECLYK